MKNKYIYIFVFLLLFVVSCTTTEKFLKTATSDQKYAKAMEWYNKGAYFKCIPVFEELMGLYKGKKTVEEIYYYYCMAEYKQGNYVLSAFHFKNFFTNTLQANMQKKPFICMPKAIIKNRLNLI
ncbi:MAG: hypothetical protein LRY27_02865 [Chitinophagales bacterium]|nr:hypothetical protein [Chitinophagales bacterium]